MRLPATAGRARPATVAARRSEEHTSELQSQSNLVCRLLLEKKKKKTSVSDFGARRRLRFLTNPYSEYLHSRTLLAQGPARVHSSELLSLPTARTAHVAQERL